MNLLAKLPQVAATIYQHTYKNGQVIAYDSKLDWSGNFSNMLGNQTNSDQQIHNSIRIQGTQLPRVNETLLNHSQ